MKKARSPKQLPYFVIAETALQVGRVVSIKLNAFYNFPMRRFLFTLGCVFGTVYALAASPADAVPDIDMHDEASRFVVHYPFGNIRPFVRVVDHFSSPDEVAFAERCATVGKDLAARQKFDDAYPLLRMAHYFGQSEANSTLLGCLGYGRFKAPKTADPALVDALANSANFAIDHYKFAKSCHEKGRSLRRTAPYNRLVIAFTAYDRDRRAAEEAAAAAEADPHDVAVMLDEGHEESKIAETASLLRHRGDRLASGAGGEY